MATNELFGKYQMLTRIASGGMAEVWLARSTSIGGFEKLLAIKRMHPRLSKNQSFVTMFIDEAKLTVQLNHPNIVQVFDFGRADEDYYMALEYVEGIDLAALAKRARKNGRALPIDAVLHIMRAVADGLFYAHTRPLGAGGRGIIHRDVSPQNVLLSFDGQVKVGDFGIAKAASEVEDPEREVFGKLAYCSPEQARGEPVDTGTDIWAAGVVLHELLTNQRLFARQNDSATLDAVERGVVPPPSASNSEVPPELDALVLRMLERDPAKRLPSAREAARLLALVATKNFPTASAYRLEDVIDELWEGKLPRLLPQPTQPPDSVTKDQRRRDAFVEDTKPVGHHTAAEIAQVAKRRDRQIRADAWPTEYPATTPAPRAMTVTEDMAAVEDTFTGDPGSPEQQILRLKQSFVNAPSLWLLVDLGRVYQEAGALPRALGAYKMAAAKFAQRGLLIQAACIYQRMLGLGLPVDDLLHELRALPSFQGLPDAELLQTVFEFRSADFSEYRDLFESNAERVDVLHESPVLSSLAAEQFVGLVLALQRRCFAPGEVIIKEGDAGDSFYLLGRGRVVVSATNFAGQKVYLTSLADGDCFGEHGYFTGEPRTASVEALEPVEVLEVSKEILNRVLLEFPTVRESLRRFYKERIAESLLAKSQIFSALPTRARNALAERFTFESYATGDLIIREGDQSDAFYALKSGRVQVYTGDDELPRKLAVLGPGDIFGEIAAIEGTRRTASVRALEECELLCLEAAELNLLLAKNADIRRTIEREMKDRAAKNQLRNP